MENEVNDETENSIEENFSGMKWKNALLLQEVGNHIQLMWCR